MRFQFRIYNSSIRADQFVTPTANHTEHGVIVVQAEFWLVFRDCYIAGLIGFYWHCYFYGLLCGCQDRLGSCRFIICSISIIIAITNIIDVVITFKQELCYTCFSTLTFCINNLIVKLITYFLYIRKRHHDLQNIASHLIIL